jgi:hypothetical protein
MLRSIFRIFSGSLEQEMPIGTGYRICWSSAFHLVTDFCVDSELERITPILSFGQIQVAHPDMHYIPIQLFRLNPVFLLYRSFDKRNTFNRKGIHDLFKLRTDPDTESTSRSNQTIQIPTQGLQDSDKANDKTKCLFSRYSADFCTTSREVCARILVLTNR